MHCHPGATVGHGQGQDAHRTVFAHIEGIESVNSAA
jgi:hypothetical protein